MGLLIQGDTLLKYLPEPDETTVTVPEGVRIIGEGAFQRCRLTRIMLPETVQHIGDNAFAACLALTEIGLPDSIVSVGASAFSCCGSLPFLRLPRLLTAIPKRMCEEARSLRQVILPEHVEAIGDGAFRFCTALEKIDIPDGVCYLGERAFEDCMSLGRLHFPAALREIRRFCCRSCCELRQIVLPDGLEIIGTQAFFESGLESAVIPPHVRNIEPLAFGGCRLLRQVHLPESAVNIGVGAFGEGIQITMQHGDCRVTMELRDLWKKSMQAFREHPGFPELMEIGEEYRIPFAACYHDCDRDLDAFLAQHAGQAAMLAIRNADAGLLDILIRGGFLHAGNIDPIIDAAIAAAQNGGDPQMQVMLTHAKHALSADPADPGAMLRL